MFEIEQNLIEKQIQAYLKENGLPEAAIQWAWIPFSGNWGMATSFFQLASQDAKAKGVKMNVAAHAQEIAQGIADVISVMTRFIEFLRPLDIEKAKEVTRMADEFIKSIL